MDATPDPPAGEPQRYLLGIAYQAGPDPRIVTGADGSRDFFSPEELEKAAWAFMRTTRSIGLFHEDGTEGHAEVVESYIHRLGPYAMTDGTTVNPGDWLIGVICDEIAWNLYINGDITGFSPQGSATRRRSTT